MDLSYCICVLLNTLFINQICNGESEKQRKGVSEISLLEARNNVFLLHNNEKSSDPSVTEGVTYVDEKGRTVVLGENLADKKSENENVEKNIAQKTEISNNRSMEINKDTSIKTEMPQPVINAYQSSSSEHVLLISLGGGEDEILIAQMAWLFHRYGKKVSVLLYGVDQREDTFPEDAKIINIPVGVEDPIRVESKLFVGVTPDDSSRDEWVSGRILWSRIAACSGLMDVESEIIAVNPDVIVSPLFLHDVCVLSLAHQIKKPIVGIITSRVGAWWTWAQLGVLPPLSEAAVPLYSLENGGLWSRTENLAYHYNYMSSLRQQWQVKAMSVLPTSWNVLPLTELYSKVSRIFLSWDPLVDPFAIPIPTAIPIGGFASALDEDTKQDIIMKMESNRAGVVLVSPGTLEVWMGYDSIKSLWMALSETPFTVIWKARHSHLVPNFTKEEEEEMEKFSRAKFIVKGKVPLNEIINHPRHRLLVSTCSESDVMSAVYFGSPILCLPVTTDQFLAAKDLQKLGVAEIVLEKISSVEKWKEMIKIMTSDRRYRLRARELAEELHDQPLTPSDALLFHIQNVIKRPESIRYKIYGSNLTILQKTNADVYLLILVCFASFFALAIIVIIKIYPVVKMSLKIKSD